MKFGLLLGTQFLPEENAESKFMETIEQVELANQLGFDSVFMVHHYLADFQFLQTVPMLGRLSAITGDMQLGTAIYILPLHHPLEVAEQFATLDVMSGGKIILGVGAGYRDLEFDSFGINKKTRVGRLEESIDIIRKLWEGHTVNFTGKYFELKGARLSLLPVQKNVPIWIGAMADKAIERAAAYGDAWIISPEVSLSMCKSRLTFYRDTLQRLNKSFDRDYPILRETCVAADPEIAKLDAWPHLETKYSAYKSWGLSTSTVEEMGNDTFLIGSPCEVINHIQSYQELGINHMIFRVQWPGMEQEKILRSIRLLGSEVIPSFRR